MPSLQAEQGPRVSAGQNTNSLKGNVIMVCRKSSRTKREFADLQSRNGSLFSQLTRGRPFSLRVGAQFDSLDDMGDGWEANQEQVKIWWKSNMPPGTRSYSELLFDILPKLKIQFTAPELPLSSKEAMPGSWSHGLFVCDESQPDFLFKHGIIDAREYAQAKQLQAASC
jgi:hypothetical protein